MPNDNPITDKQWHLDRKVPLALIAMIAAQTFAALWWASGLNARVGYLESQYSSLSPQAGQIIRLQTQLEGIDRNIMEIKNALLRGQQWQSK
tara:strand:+ start:1294 stop:1569 length:276 start_codon:yes stop_codon:yes gene_type:complete